MDYQMKVITMSSGKTSIDSENDIYVQKIMIYHYERYRDILAIFLVPSSLLNDNCGE